MVMEKLNMKLLEKIKENIVKYRGSVAFCIDNIKYTYADLQLRICAIQKYFFENGLEIDGNVIVETFNDIDCYASILAIWFSGGTFIPINPNHPIERNDLILSQIEFDFILSTSNENKSKYVKNRQFTCTKNLTNSKDNITIIETDIQRVMYILFTSGSTGIPKGVLISLKNITSFIAEFQQSGYILESEDRFLQIYDLTFDASIHCYLLPLYVGASVYTVSSNKIKYLEAYKIMQNHNITFAKFPPSVLVYLQPHFNKIQLPHIKHCLLGGENFNFEIAKRWLKCVPNAQVQNVYGPTEATINTHIFNFSNTTPLSKTYQGVISIGKPFGLNKAIIINSNNEILKPFVKGELCLGGSQVTLGYLNNHEKDKNTFFYSTINSEKIRFYKTGDSAFIDEDGDFIFCGRIDSQVQIQGYRVELQEIEHTAKKFKMALNYAVVCVNDKQDLPIILLFCEQLEVETKKLFNFLKNKLPVYMMPSQIINLQNFPLTSSGKIDKLALKKEKFSN